jgi:hypothetical protein
MGKKPGIDDSYSCAQDTFSIIDFFFAYPMR